MCGHNKNNNEYVLCTRYYVICNGIQSLQSSYTVDTKYYCPYFTDKGTDKITCLRSDS